MSVLLIGVIGGRRNVSNPRRCNRTPGSAKTIICRLIDLTRGDMAFDGTRKGTKTLARGLEPEWSPPDFEGQKRQIIIFINNC